MMSSGGKSSRVDQDVVGAPADFSVCARERIGWPASSNAITRRRRMTPRNRRLVNEFRLAFLSSRSEFTTGLALNRIFFFSRLRSRRISRNRPSRGTRAMSGSAAERLRIRHHRGFGIQQSLIHVDVDDLGAVLDLVARHLQRAV